MIGRVVYRVKVECKIGSGRMGVSKSSRRYTLARQAAIKFLSAAVSKDNYALKAIRGLAIGGPAYV
jgi:hypothetical protein